LSTTSRVGRSSCQRTAPARGVHVGEPGVETRPGHLDTYLRGEAGLAAAAAAGDRPQRQPWSIRLGAPAGELRDEVLAAGEREDVVFGEQQPMPHGGHIQPGRERPVWRRQCHRTPGRVSRHRVPTGTASTASPSAAPKAVSASSRAAGTTTSRSGPYRAGSTTTTPTRYGPGGRTVISTFV
jgi:hypothetical protein